MMQNVGLSPERIAVLAKHITDAVTYIYEHMYDRPTERAPGHRFP
jgi:hypothetical protein